MDNNTYLDAEATLSRMRNMETQSDTIKATIVEDIQTEYEISKDESIEEVISKLTDEMLKHAKNMEFEKAAELRDKIKELEKFID